MHQPMIRNYKESINSYTKLNSDLNNDFYDIYKKYKLFLI